jgi:hypothetical protein
MMEKRKIFFGFLFGLIVLSFMSNFVSAYFYFGGQFGDIIDSVVNAWTPILSSLLGGFGWSGMYLFERLLLFILLMVVVYAILGRVPLFDERNRAVRWTLSIVIPLLGIRYINYEWLSAIILQYTALAAILMCILPFLIFFYFVYNMSGGSGTLRKILWVMFVGIYLGIYSTAELTVDPTIYLWTIVAGIVCIFADGFIERRFNAIARGEVDRRFREREAANIRDQMHDVERQIREGAYGEREGQHEIRRLWRELRRIEGRR